MTKDFPDGAAMVFGATGGIGRVVSLELAKAGSNIAAIYHSNRKGADALVASISAAAGAASAHQCDVTDPASIECAVESAIKRHGRIHSLVWGAGPHVDQVFISECTPQQWRAAIDTETHGFFNVLQLILPHMRAQGGGAIVHLGSVGELRFPKRDILSVAPKAANESLIRGVACEEGRYNIRANSVLIGVIEAGMFLKLVKEGVFDQEWKRNVLKELPLKRWGAPEDIAHAVTFLASSKASYITGQQIAVAGGYGV